MNKTYLVNILKKKGWVIDSLGGGLCKCGYRNINIALLELKNNDDLEILANNLDRLHKLSDQQIVEMRELLKKDYK